MRGDHGPADDGALPWGTEVLGWPDDPYRAYRLARSGGPVRRGRLRNGRPVWLVLGCAEARAALADPRLSTDGRRFLRRYWSQAAGTGDPGLDEMSLAEHMLSTDPPDHTRLRRLVSQAFTLRRVEALRPRVAAIAATLADAMSEARSGRPGSGAGDGEVDLMDAFAFPLPIRVISELLGVPASDFGAGSVPWSASGRTTRRAGRPRPELMSTVFLLLLAGHETTVNLIGNGMAAHLGNQGQLARVRADPSLFGPAVEELLRFDGPVHHPTLRFAVEAGPPGRGDRPRR